MKEAKFFYNDKYAPVPNRPNHIGVSVFIVNKDKLLLEYRKDSDLWAVVGGGLKIDENLKDCAVREVYEETGINVDTQKLIFYKIYDNPTRIASYPDGNILRVITVTFIYKSENENIILKCSEESKELKFFSKEEVRSLNIAKTHFPLIEDFLNGFDLLK